MSELFLKILNMSISATWVVLAVVVLRLILKKAPKWVNVLLWGMVAVRLICPISLESVFSLIPSAQTLPEEVISGPSFEVQTGVAIVDNPVNNYLDDRYFEGVTVPANNGFHVMTVLSVIWMLGMAGMLAYTYNSDAVDTAEYDLVAYFVVMTCAVRVLDYFYAGKSVYGQTVIIGAVKRYDTRIGGYPYIPVFVADDSVCRLHRNMFRLMS